MVELLTTAEVSARLEKIIKEANDRLILISPYIKVSKRIRELIQEQDRQKIDVRFVYGKKETDPSEKQWLKSMSSVRTSFYENLHAKCYLNEDSALLTSMNLHESSQVNNYEMGVYVSRAEDPELYEFLLNEAKYLLTNSDPPVIDINTNSSAPNQTPQKTRRGFCIKCAKDIPFSPRNLDDQEKRPYCDECQRNWEKRMDTEWSFETREKYCHAHGSHCPTHGKDHDSSYARPVCGDCYAEVGPS